MTIQTTPMRHARGVTRALTQRQIQRRLTIIDEIADNLAARIRRHGMLHPSDDHWERTPLKQLVGAASVRHLSADRSLRMQLDLIRGLDSMRIPVELRRRSAPRRTRAQE